MLADCYYSSYWTQAGLPGEGIDYVGRQQHRRTTDFRRGQRVGREDHVVQWAKPVKPSWMDDATYAALPDTLAVRELRVRVSRRGFRTRVVVVVTTLLDAVFYSAPDLAALFVMLAGAYYERTGDRAFVANLWPHLERALAWIDTYGDVDNDGFVEYARHTPHGLANQGWKDSHDAVFHADGTLAEGPIALYEVQGYVYAAKRHAAALATLLGHCTRAAELEQQAQALQERFERAFWCEDLGTYAVALDGHKRPCRVSTSNAGQVLLTGIARPEHAERVAQTLLTDDTFSGWGIRTVAASEHRYNPMSYHNGSIWPHDNALIAAGLARYGLKDQALKVLAGLFDASLFFELHRLPELFCGFARRPGEGPTLYPVACAPQAWASAAVFLLLQACLGVSFHHPTPQIRFTSPLLPAFLEDVHLTNLTVGETIVGLRLQRHPQDLGVQVTRRRGDIDVVIVK